jgi:hypothetical protein
MQIKIDAKNIPITLRKLFAQDLISTIIDRTKSGKDVNGNQFKEYSEAYKDSILFKQMGKTSKVNLTFYGDMLGAINYKLQGDSVVIYFEDELESAKAHGHQNGSNNLPVRKFFGLSNDEVSKLSKQYEQVTDTLKLTEFVDIFEGLNNIVVGVRNESDKQN